MSNGPLGDIFSCPVPSSFLNKPKLNIYVLSCPRHMCVRPFAQCLSCLLFHWFLSLFVSVLIWRLLFIILVITIWKINKSMSKVNQYLYPPPEVMAGGGTKKTIKQCLNRIPSIPTQLIYFCSCVSSSSIFFKKSLWCIIINVHTPVIVFFIQIFTISFLCPSSFQKHIL